MEQTHRRTIRFTLNGRPATANIATHETIVDVLRRDFGLFGGIEFLFGFVGEILGDGVGAQVDAAREDFAFFEKEEVAGLGTDVQEHGAVLELTIIVTEGIAEGGRGDVG